MSDEIEYLTCTFCRENDSSVIYDEATEDDYSDRRDDYVICRECADAEAMREYDDIMSIMQSSYSLR